MTTYDQLFPANPDGFAHPDASLALAEELSPAGLLEELRLDFGDPIDNSLHVAWTLVEYAIRTPEHTGDEQYFAHARQALDAIITSGEPITDPRVMNARLLQVGLPGFQARARHDRRIAPGVTDQAQIGVGQILLDYLSAEQPAYEDRLGRLSEILAQYAVLLGRRFPFLASPREECNRFIPDNHDFYVLDNGRRVPFSVKHVGPAEDNPLVVMLRVGSTATELVRELHLRVPQEWRNASDRATWWLTDIMARHARRQILEPPEVKFLIAFVNRIETSIDTFREGGYSQTAVDLGDLVVRQRRPRT